MDGKTNVPVLSVEKTVDMLSEAYLTVLKAGKPLKTIPSVMLWGPPGVGKSQGVRQLAERIEKGSGKKVTVTDVRLLLFNPIDLRGIPVANEDRTLAVWLKPKIFQMDPGEDAVNILFLDEVSAAPQSVQAAAYQLTLDRTVGEHRLPENCLVIAAGNRVTDKSVAYKMPKALANRLLHIEIEGSFESWRAWAVRTGVHPKVLGYLSFRADRLYGFDPSSDELAFPTPRTWEMVSDLLNTVSDDVPEVFPLISGLVGSGIAFEFRSWCSVFDQLPDPEAILAGRPASVPDRTDMLYALVSSLTAHAREKRSDTEAIGHLLTYARALPMEFGQLLIRNLESFSKEYGAFLKTVPEFLYCAEWQGSERNGKIRA